MNFLRSLNTALIYKATSSQKSEVFRYSTHCQRITQFYLSASRALIHEWNEPHLPLPNSQPKLVLIYDPGGMEGWVGLGTTMVSKPKQSAHDCYVMDIAVVGSRSKQGKAGQQKRIALVSRCNRELPGGSITLRWYAFDLKASFLFQRYIVQAQPFTS